MSNILIIKHGSLGDIAQASGAIQDISDFHKDDKVYLLTSKPYIDLFKKNIAFGVGPNNFRRDCSSIKYEFKPVDILDFQYIYHDDFPIQNCSTHPHNIFFQLISETGIFGILHYFIIIILLFYETCKFLFKKNYYHIKFFFLLPIIYYVNPIIPSGNFFNNWYMAMGIIGLPFYLYSILNLKNLLGYFHIHQG